MSTHCASTIKTDLGGRRLQALIAIPVVVLAMSTGIFAAAQQPESASSAAVCNLPSVPNCAA
jgi:hypothetical protein